MPRYVSAEGTVSFCTVTTLEWLPIFLDRRYCDVVVDSLRFCRAQKGLHVMAYVLMPNHLHLIAGAVDGLEPVIRDFKRFTSRTVHDMLRADGRTSILRSLHEATEPARRARGEISLWQPGFHPQSIVSRAVFRQKVRYIHENPVRKGLVARAED